MKKVIGVFWVGLTLLAGCASTTRTSEAAETITSQDVFVHNEGREVPATLVLPAGKGPFPLVVMEHGFAGSRQEGGGFAHLAGALAKADIASIRMDFPSCGDSKASFIDYSLTTNISDAEACRNWALANAPIDSKRIGILGYSNGGRQALMMLASKNIPYKAMGLLAPAFYTTSLEKYAGAFSVAETQNRLAKAKVMGFYSMEWFGTTLQVSAKNYEDDLASITILDKITPSSVKIKSLVVYGDKDVVVLPNVSQGAAAAIGAELVEVPDANHDYGFYKEYGEQPDITAAVEKAFVDFFSKEL
jgi:pimeloyl-ACP methyl ester carboxylesterase